MLGRGYEGYYTALQSLRIKSLAQRREELALRFVRSLLRSPEHRGMLPPTLQQIHGRALRHSGRLQPVRCRTERYRKSAIPYMVNLLNSKL